MSDTHEERDFSDRGDPAAESASTPGPPALTDGTAFRLLDNRRRRYLVYYLLDSDGEVSLSRAVDVVTAWETDCPVEAVRSTDRRTVYSALRRSHLPRLETEGIVTHDADAGTLSLGPDAESVTRWLVADDEQKWNRRYLGLAGAGVVVLLTDAVAAVPSLALEGCSHATVLLLFAGLTLVATYDSYR